MKEKTKNKYSFQAIDTSLTELKTLSIFLSKVFDSSKFTVAYLDWLYNQNPVGSVVGFNAFFQNKIAGHYALIPVKARYKNKNIKALLSLNTATGKKHQGQGLFTTLANKTYLKSKELGHEMIFGVANANSIHGFIKKLDWNYIGQLNTHVSFTLPTKVNPRKLEDCLTFPLSENITNWRLSNPNFKYSRLNLKNINIIANDVNFFARSIIKISESIDSDFDPLIPKINFWIGISNSYSWSSGLLSGFKIPDLLKPSPLHLIYRNLSTEINLDSQNIHFEAINFDAY